MAHEYSRVSMSIRGRASWLRMWLGSLLCLVLALGSLGCSGGCEPAVAASPKVLDYIERTTRGARSSEALPLLVVLHGLGDTPEDFVDLYAGLSTPARIIAARAPDPWSSGSSWFPIDHKPDSARAIEGRARDVRALIEHLSRARPTLGKAVVSGFSQGGVLSFALAAYHPEVLTGAVPVAGGLFPGLPPAKAAPKAFSLHAFHGRDDRRILLTDAERAMSALKSKGTRASLTDFPNVGHSIPPAMARQVLAAIDELLDRAKTSARPPASSR
jgi:phospholipase/carboxylesterase